jgi:protein O-mannosyl-transferase
MSDPDVGEFRTPWLLSWRAFVVTGLLASLPYLNSLHGHFVYDDKVAVMSNPDVTMHALLPISDVFLHDFWGNVMRINLPEWLGLNLTIPKSSWTHNSYRPLTVLSLRFNCWLGGAQPFIYHVTNIVIHIAAVWCGMYALTTLLGRGRRYHAAIASALFACHPVHTEVVTNVTSRAETLGSVFVLLAIGIYFHCTNPHVRSSTPGWLASFLGCLLSFVVVIVAVLCKETGLVTPIMIAALDVIVNTPSMVYNPDNDHQPDRFWRNFLSYVRHILCNMHWLRVVSLVCLQALLLYVRVAWLSSG